MDQADALELLELARERWAQAYAQWLRADPDSDEWEVQRMVVAKYARLVQALYDQAQKDKE